jgi:hypothetical protein
MITIKSGSKRGNGGYEGCSKSSLLMLREICFTKRDK